MGLAHRAPAPARPAGPGRPALGRDLDGAHPHDPSRLPDGRSLAEVEPGLPYLVKLLAAEQPLSIQAHPDLAQARAGFAAEEARGVPASAPDRLYKDANHKPELLVAIEPTQALCGFRSPASIRSLADRLACAAWSDLVARGGSGPGGAGDLLRALFATATTLPRDTRADLLREVAAACRLAVLDPDEDLRSCAWWVLRLAERYPYDTGALAPLMLDLVALRPGDGLFVGAGVLHSYLHGAGVEVQASSDNVLRGGLTGKHVDVAELLRTVRFEPSSAHRVAPRSLSPGLEQYDVPVDDFAVWRVRPGGGAVTVPADGPCIVVSLDGDVRVCGLPLAPGTGAFVPAPVQVVVAGDGTCLVTGRGVAGAP